jgi:8-oxo-dGTP pyrophosphatase MutT (NUDIX family)
MRPARKNRRRSRAVKGRSGAVAGRLPAPSNPLSQLRKLRSCKQVAAVCYRVCDGEIEFLLVRTSGGDRWTFPKGSVARGLTQAQSAALEAFEEAGVHGRIEEVRFARYLKHGRCDLRDSSKRSADEFAVNAHLCEVFRLGRAQESNRNRTWFTAKEARLRLQEGRERDEGAEFASVVEKAAARIRHLRKPGGAIVDHFVHQSLEQWAPRDALQQVHFEISIQPYNRMHQAWFLDQATSRNQQLPAQASDISHVDSRMGSRIEMQRGEVLQFGSPRASSPPASSSRASSSRESSSRESSPREASPRDSMRDAKWLMKKQPKALGTGEKSSDRLEP